MKHFKETLLENIEEIDPTPKWHFILLSLVWWASVVLSILLGSLAFSFVVFELFSTDWSLITRIGNSSMRVIFALLPYLWFIALIVLVGTTKFFFSKTKWGYKYTTKRVVTLVLILSIIFGSTFTALGATKATEKGLYNKIPQYRTYRDKVINRVVNPEQGRLGGKIETIDNDIASLIDINRDTWTVDISAIDEIPDNLDTPVLLLGEKTDEFYFVASEMRKIRKEQMRKIREILPKKLEEHKKNILESAPESIQIIVQKRENGEMLTDEEKDELRKYLENNKPPRPKFNFKRGEKSPKRR